MKLVVAEKFKSTIRFFASLFASREFAVLYCVVGTFAEIAHMYYLTYSISALSGWFKVAQAVMLSGFISSSLLYFVLISDDRQTTSEDSEIRERAKKDSKRVNLAINIFTFINIAINFYYYCRHLIIDSDTWQMFDFIFAILVSCLLPITIKLYANGIHVKDWVVSEEFEISNTNNIADSVKSELVEDLKSWIAQEQQKFTKDTHQYMNELVVTKINEIQLPNKEQIKIAFEEHSQLFLKQFDNKLKILTERLKPSKGIETPDINKPSNTLNTNEHQINPLVEVTKKSPEVNSNNSGDTRNYADTNNPVIADTPIDRGFDNLLESSEIAMEPETTEIQSETKPNQESKDNSAEEIPVLNESHIETEDYKLQEESVPSEIGISVDEYLSSINK